MKRSLLASIVLALALGAALVPAVLGADDVVPPAVDATPTPPAAATPTPAPTATPFGGNGEISIDPTFITDTPTPSPTGEVQGAAGRPQTTPPPTDSSEATAVSGTSLQVFLLLAVAGCSLALLAVRVPPSRRR